MLPGKSLRPREVLAENERNLEKMVEKGVCKFRYQPQDQLQQGAFICLSYKPSSSKFPYQERLIRNLKKLFLDIYEELERGAPQGWRWRRPTRISPLQRDFLSQLVCQQSLGFRQQRAALSELTPLWRQLTSFRASLVAQLVKNPPAMQETLVWILAWEYCLEKG